MRVAGALVVSVMSVQAMSVRVEVCTGPNCCGRVFSGDGRVEVVGVDCLSMCERGPNVRCVVGEAPTIFGADAMTSEERSSKCFHEVDSDERRQKVVGAAAKLQSRLGAVEEPPTPKITPKNFFDGYSETELRDLLNLHEDLKTTDTTNQDDTPSAENIFDMHAIIQAMVEKEDEKSTANGHKKDEDHSSPATNDAPEER